MRRARTSPTSCPTTAACSVPGALDVGGVATTTGGLRTNTIDPRTGSSVTATVTRSLDSDKAVRADQADLATRATNADRATSAALADYATEALYAATATRATLADRALNADHATRADSAAVADTNGENKLVQDNFFGYTPEMLAQGLLGHSTKCPPSPYNGYNFNTYVVNGSLGICAYK